VCVSVCVCECVCISYCPKSVERVKLPLKTKPNTFQSNISVVHSKIPQGDFFLYMFRQIERQRGAETVKSSPTRPRTLRIEMETLSLTKSPSLSQPVSHPLSLTRTSSCFYPSHPLSLSLSFHLVLLHLLSCRKPHTHTHTNSCLCTARSHKLPYLQSSCKPLC